MSSGSTGMEQPVHGDLAAARLAWAQWRSVSMDSAFAAVSHVESFHKSIRRSSVQALGCGEHEIAASCIYAAERSTLIDDASLQGHLQCRDRGEWEKQNLPE